MSRAKNVKEQIGKIRLQRLAAVIIGEAFSGGRTQHEVDQAMEVIKKKHDDMFKGNVIVDISLKPEARP